MWFTAALFLLGAYHGLNPAMGWLFAVALGLQEKSGRAVLNAILPLGVGHLVSVLLVVGAAQLARLVLPLSTVQMFSAAALMGFGLFRLFWRRHPRWVGMRVGSCSLALWSLLMASAHGAGLMLLPFVLARPIAAMPAGHIHAIASAGMPGSPPRLAAEWWFPVGMHTAGYLAVTALVALVVYHKLGIGIVRRAWFNVDLLWVGALFTTGLLTLAL